MCALKYCMMLKVSVSPAMTNQDQNMPDPMDRVHLGIQYIIVPQGLWM